METISVKGMVCSRCIITLKQAISDNGIQVASIELGKITLTKNSSFSYSALSELISALGFEILYDKQTKIIRHIKQLVEKYLDANENKQKFSEVISSELNMNYDQLSNIFSEQSGMTLERYIIHQKTEKVKHLLSNSNLSLTEISYRLNYSSVHHLSRQFKEITGKNPSIFKEMAQYKKI